jgi:ClpP class serine protease
MNKNVRDSILNDKDINAFMETVHKLDRSKGLDLILHTPGGDISATEQIIKYLHSMFNGDIRAIIPQMAMSAGSMVAVSCRSIMMGKQSCLGPFDPQLNNLPCQSVLKEFERAINDVSRNPASLGLWQTIISKLNPTFLTLCQQADELSKNLADDILSKTQYSEEIKERIKGVFVNNDDSKVHSRHIDIQRCKDVGLNIEELEADPKIQDMVLSIHHCCMILGESSNIVKVVENNIGGEFSYHLPPQQPHVAGPLMQFQMGDSQMP